MMVGHAYPHPNKPTHPYKLPDCSDRLQGSEARICHYCGGCFSVDAGFRSESINTTCYSARR